MRIEILDRNTGNPDGVKGYAEKKLEKISKFFPHDFEARVVMKKEREQQKCEVTINADGLFFRSSVSTTDMHASVDACVTSIERQIRKHRTKLGKKVKVVDQNIDFEVEDVADYSPVRRKSFNMKPMTSDEAILQMQLLSHRFYVFRDSENREQISVVYCRDDGGYGIISEA